MVCEVVTDVEWRHEDIREPMLFDMVSGLASIVRTRHATVLGDRSQPILDLVPRDVGEDPQHRVVPPPCKKDEHRSEEHLPKNETGREVSVLAVLEAGEARFQRAVARDSGGVSAELPAHRHFGDWVEGVEQKVGLVRSELVPVMVGVASTVVMRAGSQREPPENPDTDEIVHHPVREQQSMCCLVVEDVHAGLNHAHRSERKSEHPPRGSRYDRPRDEHRCDQNQRNGDCVSAVIDLAKLRAELRSWTTVRPEKVTSGERVGDFVHHATGHRRDDVVMGQSIARRLRHVVRVPNRSSVVPHMFRSPSRGERSRRFGVCEILAEKSVCSPIGLNVANKAVH